MDEWTHRSSGYNIFQGIVLWQVSQKISSSSAHLIFLLFSCCTSRQQSLILHPSFGVLPVSSPVHLSFFIQREIRKTELSAVPQYSPLIRGFARSKQHSRSIQKNRRRRGRRREEVERAAVSKRERERERERDSGGKFTILPYNPLPSHLNPDSANLFLLQWMGRIPMEMHLRAEHFTARLPASAPAGCTIIIQLTAW